MRHPRLAVLHLQQKSTCKESCSFLCEKSFIFVPGGSQILDLNIHKNGVEEFNGLFPQDLYQDRLSRPEEQRSKRVAHLETSAVALPLAPNQHSAGTRA